MLLHPGLQHHHNYQSSYSHSIYTIKVVGDRCLSRIVDVWFTLSKYIDLHTVSFFYLLSLLCQDLHS